MKGPDRSGPFRFCIHTIIPVMCLTARSVDAGLLRRMAFKETRLYSILSLTCPHCHEGRFFVSHPYDLSRAGDLHARCGRCGRTYSKEPGFYYGAMYVAYGIGVAVCVTTWVVMEVLWPKATMLQQILTISGVMVVGTPLFYALSKIIWANMFFSYQGPPPEDGPGAQAK